VKQLTLVLAGGAMLLLSCASETSTVAVDGERDSGSGVGAQPGEFEVVSYDGPIEVRCGSVNFPDRTIDLDSYPVFTDDLSDFIEDGFREEFDLQWEEGLKDVVLHELERGSDRLHLFGREADPASGAVGYREIAIDRVDGEWDLDIWGGCGPPLVSVDGFEISELRLNPDDEPTSSSTSLALLVTERACASGELPIGRGVAPIVFESDTSVEILVLIEEPRRGGENCPGNPSFPVSVDLETPLGDRVIRNIAFEPSVELIWPIPQRPSELQVFVQGEPPAIGTANVFSWTGSHSGALLLESLGWSDFAGRIQGWAPADEPRTISGFVATCGDGGCGEECEGADCVAAERLLGESCSAEYVVTEGFDSTITITYGDGTCTIDQALTPIE
jgi:hypothetical protein